MGVDVSASASLISSSTRCDDDDDDEDEDEFNNDNHKADQVVDVETDQTISSNNNNNNNNTTKENDIVDVQQSKQPVQYHDHDLLVDLQTNNLFFDELVDKIPTKLYIAGQSGDDYNPKYWKGHSKESKVARKAKNKQSKRATFDPATLTEKNSETKQRLENDNNHGNKLTPQKPGMNNKGDTFRQSVTATISTVTTTLSPDIDHNKSRKEVLREKLHAKLAEKRGNRPCPSDPTTIISKRAARRAEKKKRQAEAIQRNSSLCREEVDTYLAQFNQPPQSPTQSQQSVSISLLCREEIDTYLDYIPIGHPDSMMSAESVRRAVEEFTVKPTDMMVATFPKTGTTVLTWICHLLRTLSNTTRIHEKENEEDQDVDENGMYEYETHIMNSFETIYEVVPWPTLSWDIGYDPNKNNQQQQQQSSSSSSLPLFPPPLQPRVFKSHLRMASIYRGCKYIVTIRDPGKTAISFYNFFISKKVPIVIDTDITIRMDVSTFLMDTPYVKGHSPTPENPQLRPSIWEYYREYHALLECSDVLIVIYEDMVQDMSTTIKQIGQFMNIIDIDNDNNNNNEKKKKEQSLLLIEKITRMTTKSFMAQYMSKFDEPYDRAKKFNRAQDLTQLAPGKKIAVKKHPQVFNDQAKLFLKDQWKEVMNTHPFGYETYSDFVDTIRTRNQQLFG